MRYAAEGPEASTAILADSTPRGPTTGDAVSDQPSEDRQPDPGEELERGTELDRIVVGDLCSQDPVPRAHAMISAPCS